MAEAKTTQAALTAATPFDPKGTTIDLTAKTTVSKWDSYLDMQFKDVLPFMDLFGGSNAPIYVPSNTTSQVGVKLIVNFKNRDRENRQYFINNADTHFAEKVLKHYTDEVAMGMASVPYIIGKDGQSIEPTAVAIDLAMDAKEQVVFDLQEFITNSFFSQLSGKALDTDKNGVASDGFNALSAPTNTVAGAGAEALTAAVKMAKMLRMPRVRGLKGGAQWVLYMSPATEELLMNETAIRNNMDIVKAIAVANSEDKWLSDDYLGTIRGIELRTSTYCPDGKAYLLGGHALTYITPESGFRPSTGEGSMIKTNVEPWDANTKVRIKSTWLGGLKKAVCNGKDFSVIEVSISKGK